MERYLTKRRALIALSVVILLVAWNRGVSLLYGMAAVLIATTLVAQLMPRFALRGVGAARGHVTSAFEGEEIEIAAVVENASGRARRMVELVDALPMAAPEHRRPFSFVARLAGGERREVRYKVLCDRRGDHPLGPFTLRSGFPLGLTSREEVLADSVTRLLVYPQVFPIAALPLPVSGRTPLRGTEALAAAGGAEDFFGTREYRSGDSPRFIHWASTARHGELIVKEFETRSATELTIVLDLSRWACVGEDKESTLEYAVKIAASAADYAARRGHAVQLLGYGERPYGVPSGRGLTHLGRVLETLARVRADGEVPYPTAIERAAGAMRDGGTALLLLCDYEDDPKGHLRALGLLKASHVQPVCVFIDPSSFEEGGRRGAAPSPVINAVRAQGAPTYVVRRGDHLPSVFAKS